MRNVFEEEPFLLKDLNDDEQKFVVKMPYRVGMFVSLSDTTGGDTADDEELKALEIIVTSYAQDYCKSEFVQEVMNKTVEMKEHWPQWLENIENVPNECEELITMLEARLYDKELDGLKQNLYDIGRSVALAYREMQESPSGLTKFIKKIQFSQHRKTSEEMGQEPLLWEEYLNVSQNETKALTKLATVLKLKIT